MVETARPVTRISPSWYAIWKTKPKREMSKAAATFRIRRFLSSSPSRLSLKSVYIGRGCVQMYGMKSVVIRSKIHFIFPHMLMRWGVIILLAMVSMDALGQNTAPVFTIGDRFVSSAGFTFPRANKNKVDEQMYGLCYSPALNLLNKHSDFSIAIASRLSGAWHFSSETDTSDYGVFSFPAFLQFNGGHLATHNFYSSFGISFGAGYNFSVINSELTTGPLLITAIRFWFLRQSFTVSYSQSYFESRHTLMHELSLQLNIGRYLKDAKSNNKISKFVKPFRK